jgi:hypothetical protein
MPNHCYSHLEITGEPKLLNKFMKQVEVTESEATSHLSATKFSLNKVIPMPEELHNGDGWYDWRVAHWGTKWDLCDLEPNDFSWENGYIYYDFWTAWSPIEPILEKLTNEYPELTFSLKFSDEGGGFWGLWNFHNGTKEVVEEGDSSTDEITCRVREEFFQQGSEHHLCQDCQSEWLECQGEDKEDTEYRCEECQTSLSTLDKDLWEETNAEHTAIA